jgi:hypothetical protein
MIAIPVEGQSRKGLQRPVLSVMEPSRKTTYPESESTEQPFI